MNEQADATLYAIKTRRRMDRAVCELQAIVRCGTGDANRILHWIGEQEEACREAGFRYMASLCESIQDVLVEIHRHERSWSPPTMTCLLNACRDLLQHASIYGAGGVSGESESHAGATAVEPAAGYPLPAAAVIDDCTRSPPADRFEPAAAGLS